MNNRRTIGRVFLIGFCLFLLLCSIRSLLGFVYRWTSSEDVFVCHDLFCLRPGIAHPYYILDRRTRWPSGRTTVLYACSLHPLPSFVRLNALDRPTPFSFLMASFPVWGLALWVFGRSRKHAQAVRQRGISSREALSEAATPTFMASLDKAADGVADSVSFIIRRFFVNGLCIAAVGLPVLAIADMKLPKTANVTLAILAVLLSVVLWRLATVIEKDYPEDDELHDEATALTFRLFIKRVVSWSVFIYGLVGIGYLIAAIFYGDSL